MPQLVQTKRDKWSPSGTLNVTGEPQLLQKFKYGPWMKFRSLAELAAVTPVGEPGCKSPGPRRYRLGFAMLRSISSSILSSM